MHNKHSNNVGSVRHLKSELGTSKKICPPLAPLATVSDSGGQRITSFLLGISAKAFPSCNTPILLALANPFKNRDWYEIW